MKRLIIILLIIILPCLASAGDIERFALSSQLVNINFAALPPLPGMPLPKSEPAGRANEGSSPEWIKAVKEAYFSTPQGCLPPAEENELPAAAIQQIQWDWNATAYPSKAYKMMVENRPAFVIENDNSYGLFVNIFDENGVNVAYGGFDENYDFYWLI
ncbi:MAG TPA: hypothetical protein DCL44_04160 [Elusimicrobia bacterium]|nr:hypothetical protein [Elusimicrobiota bacterium]